MAYDVRTLRTWIIASVPSRSDYRGVAKTWRGDLLAGLTVGIVALPLALGFGVASGVGAKAGIITAIVAGVFAAIFGGSSVQVSGPTGAMAVVLVPIVARDGIAAVSTVAIMAGLIVLVLGALGFGRAIQFVPWPVLEGFTVGIALTITLQQVPLILGLPKATGSSVVNSAYEACAHAQLREYVPALVLAVVVGVVMIVWPKVSTRIPSSMVAVIIATAVSIVFHFHIPTLSGLPTHFPGVRVPNLGASTLRKLGGPALAVAALASIESLLSARVGDVMTGTTRYSERREMIGQGVANVACGLFGGMPATGAIARTAVNVKAGGRSRIAAITHSFVIVVIMLSLTSTVERVPLSVLGAVLVMTAARMIDQAKVIRLVRVHVTEALVFSLTALVTIFVNLVTAIEVGLLVAGVLALREVMLHSGVVQETLSEHIESSLDDVALLNDHVAVFRFDGALFFGAVPRFVDSLRQVEGVRVVILRLKNLSFVDASGGELLARMIEDLQKEGITVLVKGMSSEHRRVMTAAGPNKGLVSDNHYFDALDVAIAHAQVHARGSSRGE
jgi:SulP family sulfate permease